MVPEVPTGGIDQSRSEKVTLETRWDQSKVRNLVKRNSKSI